MRYAYDPTADALYVSVLAGEIAAQVEMPDGVIVDVDFAERVLGIDVMGPDRGWSPDEVIDRFHLGNDDASFLRQLAKTEWSNHSERESRPSANAASGTPQLVPV
ncbi:MAG: DUF2283 domain-containing protein [Acidimicrobiales bacterium]